MEKKYNIIMITLDGARVDRIVDMDNFKKLMKKGTFFPQTITSAPYTIAAIHAIFSGSNGNRTGTDTYYGSPLFKKNLFATLPVYLKKEGYYTIGDFLSELIAPKIGFDEFLIHNELKDNLTKKHLHLLDKVNKIKEKQNFFLYLHYSNIHTSLLDTVLKKYNNFDKTYFEKKEENSREYNTYLRAADQYLGKIIEKINECDMLKNTIVIVQSDHGVSVGEKIGERAYGAFCYDYTVKTFVFFLQPNIFPAKEVKQQVRIIDILPTILDAFGIKESKDYEKMDGKSMMPLIKGKKEDRYAFIEAGNPLKSKEPPKKPNIRAIRTSKWKFIHNYWDDSEELYNLEKDLGEKNNLIKKEKKIVDGLRNKLNFELKKGLSLEIKQLKKKL